MGKTRNLGNLASNNSLISDNSKIGIGTTVATSTLTVVGNSSISGVVTASSFVGSLTGNATGLNGTPNITVGIATATEFDIAGSNNTLTAGGLSVGFITATSASFSGNVSIAGTLTYEDVTNVDSVGLITARSGVRINTGGLTVSGVTTVAAGSTSAPSVSPTGNSNTGIFFPAADTIAFAEGGVESARFDSSGRFAVGTTTPQNTIHLHKNDGLQNYLQITNATTGSASTDGALFGINNDEDVIVWQREAGALQFGTNNAERARIDSSGKFLIGTSSSSGNFLLEVNGAIRDSAGSLRSAPQNSQSTAYVLVASDAGKHINTTSGGVTVPASVFSAGDIIAIFNNSNISITITQGGGVTLRQAGTANTGNRTLAQYGLASIMCVGSNTFTISGAGLS